MIEGTVPSPKNLRSSPNDASSENMIGTIGTGSVFTGNTTFQDAKGRGLWIKLETINGSPVIKETWLAGWVVSYKTVPDPLEEPLGIPTSLKIIEFFEGGKSRETYWENPKLVE